MVLGLEAESRYPKVAPEPPPTPDRRSVVDATAMSLTYPAAHQLLVDIGSSGFVDLYIRRGID